MRHIFTFLLVVISIQFSFSQHAIKFNDSYLEAAIRVELEIPSDSIYPSDMLSLTNLSSNSVASLKGLEYATNLNSLRLSSAYVVDISPLSELNSLSYLDIGNWNVDIVDLSPLSNLTSLKHLGLDACFDQQVTGINNISGLSNLSYLSLIGNGIDDISALKSLTGLDSINLAGNNLNEEDLVDLYGLTNLKSPVLSLLFDSREPLPLSSKT